MNTEKFKSLFLKNVEKDLDSLIEMGYFFNCKHDIHDGCLINPGNQCEDCYSGDTAFEMGDGDAIKVIFADTARDYKEETGVNIMKGKKRYEDDEDDAEDSDEDDTEDSDEDDAEPFYLYEEIRELGRSNKKVQFTQDEMFELLKIAQKFDIEYKNGLIEPIISYDPVGTTVLIYTKEYPLSYLFFENLVFYFYILAGKVEKDSSFKALFYKPYVDQALDILKKAESRIQ